MARIKQLLLIPLPCLDLHSLCFAMITCRFEFGVVLRFAWWWRLQPRLMSSVLTYIQNGCGEEIHSYHSQRYLFESSWSKTRLKIEIGSPISCSEMICVDLETHLSNYVVIIWNKQAAMEKIAAARWKYIILFNYRVGIRKPNKSSLKCFLCGHPGKLIDWIHQTARSQKRQCWQRVVSSGHQSFWNR